MGFKDMREWIARLEADGELKRITAEVDWNLELGAIAQRVLAGRGPALLFEHIKDYQHTRCRKLFVNGLTKRSRVALMLGLAGDATWQEVQAVIRKRFKEPIRPVSVATGPVKENIVRGESIDLYQFPVPKWHPLDGGRYIDTWCGIVTRDPETGATNVGLYRGMIQDRNKIGKLLVPSQHWGQHYQKYQARKEAMPVAIAYGWDDAMPFVASVPLAHPPSEYEVIGAIRQEAVEVVRCETSDLEVPASAEIVVEGSISPEPSAYEEEGPFGEWTGYYGWTRKRPVVQVECITHRHDPIFRGQVEGTKPGVISEGGYAGLYTYTSLVWDYLEKAGVPGVLDIVSAPLIVVKIRKMYAGHAKQVAAAIFGSALTLQFAKIVIVVDEDVDIHDFRALQLAIRDRVDAKDDVILFPGLPGNPLDPSLPWDLRDELTYGASPHNKLLIDATIDWTKHPIREEWGKRRLPPLSTDTSAEIGQLIERRWKEYGF